MYGCGCGSIKLYLWILTLAFFIVFMYLECISFLQPLKNVNTILNLWAIQMHVLSWVCPVGYYLPIPGGGVSGGDYGGGNCGSGGDLVMVVVVIVVKVMKLMELVKVNMDMLLV